MALQLTIGIAVVVGVLLDTSRSTDRILKLPRIRSSMLGTYQRLKIMAVTPSTFNCPPANAHAWNPNMCHLANIPASELNQYLPQASCAGNGPCGIEVKNLVFQNMHLKGTIEYTGTDFNFKPTDVDIPVPPEILQSSQNDCFSIDPNKPIFVGFLADGSPDCRPLQGQCTGLGEYVQSVDPKTLKVTCGTFQPSVGCPASQYMTSLKWSGSSFSVTCADRPDPFAKFAFAATTTFGDPAIAAAAAPSTPANSCAVPANTTGDPTQSLPVAGGGAPTGDSSCTYTNVFDDEFETIFDTTKWNDKIWYASACPTTNYSVEQGVLKIWPVMEADGTFCNRTIDTDGKFSNGYGFYEMEAKLPVGKGVWPAFWLLNRVDPTRDEIDIMEAYPGGGPASGWGDASLHPTAAQATVHQGSVSSDTVVGAQKYTYSDLSDGFHKYGFKWEPNKMTFYFDGNPYYTITQDLTKPMYVLLDLWFGSSSGTPDNTTPQGKANSYQVNYVRVWKCTP